MPTYDYVCEACEHPFEAFQSISDKPIKKCPACGKLKARRLIGAGSGFIFKGSGFYITDYRSSDYKQKAEAEKKAATPAEAGSDKKGESKGEPKPAAAAKSKEPSAPATSTPSSPGKKSSRSKG